MFDDIGTKLKGLAYFSCWIGIFSSMILGIVAIRVRIIYGVLIIVLGPLYSWISSWVIYAIGEIAENTQKKSINKETSKNAKAELFLKSNYMNQVSTMEKKHCPHCGDTVTSKVCDMCGKENNLF